MDQGFSPWQSAGNRHYGHVPLFDPEQGTCVRSPLGAGPGWWVGAPSAVYDAASGRFYLYFRYRKPRELGRGMECRLAESSDGVNFTDIWGASKADLNTQSMEKSGLIRLGDAWFLYLSFVGEDGRWRIAQVQADHPAHFDLKTLTDALSPDDCGAEGVKDPAVYSVGGLLHMIVSYAPRPRQQVDGSALHSTGDVYNTGLLKSHTGLAVSTEGRHWTWKGDILTPPESGWDSYCTRLGSVVYQAPVWLGFYDGSASVEENYEEKAGLCVSADLQRWDRLTPQAPWVLSPHASGSIRYVEVVPGPGGLHYFYEYTLPDGSHELRTSMVPV